MNCVDANKVHYFSIETKVRVFLYLKMRTDDSTGTI